MGHFLTGGLTHILAGMTFWRHLSSISICSGSERSPNLLGWGSAKSAQSTDLQVFLASVSHQIDKYPPSSPSHWAKIGSKGQVRYLWPALPLASNAPCDWFTLALLISISTTSVKCSLSEMEDFQFNVLAQFQLSPASLLHYSSFFFFCYFSTKLSCFPQRLYIKQHIK